MTSDEITLDDPDLLKERKIILEVKDSILFSMLVENLWTDRRIGSPLDSRTKRILGSTTDTPQNQTNKIKSNQIKSKQTEPNQNHRKDEIFVDLPSRCRLVAGRCRRPPPW